MEPLTEKKVLISGASFAGLSTAYWMNRLGYHVTVIEIAPGIKKGGTPVNIRENTIEIVERMGLLDQILANKLSMNVMEFINSGNSTAISGFVQQDVIHAEEEEYEIERDVLLNILFGAVKNDAEFIFGDRILGLEEKGLGIEVSFQSGPVRSFDLVFGCDGVRSDIRKLWFGADEEFSHFLGAYGSVTILNRLLIPGHTAQVYNEPGKLAMMSAYNNKTDIIMIFSSEEEIPYDHRDKEQKQNILADHFAGAGWRTPELLEEVKQADNFYFDKLYQIKMPCWTKGRVALVGDAGYCASPAAGMGGSLAIDGAAALAAAFEKCGGNFELAFREYNESFRPFIDEVQANAEQFGLEFLVPKTEEAIRERNIQATPR